MKIKNIVLIITMLLLFPLVSAAQLKFEREYRIQPEVTPPTARAFIDAINPDLKIKWYKEESSQGISIEAKFIYVGKKYSIEFDTLGNIQDAEFIIKKSDINPVVYRNMEVHLDSLYNNWKFQKIQKQYKGKPEDIITSINNDKPNPAVETAYEIVLKGKSSGIAHLYEVTFNEHGEIHHFEQIIQEKADHLEY
ncbi:hypothetical protein QQ020_23705 [Fulvivirgaceae bacterium BMA12]|uniref:Uncharacterized protein n=1 Tax=Agaribacillus aureus TaxID=3051825 RepID=A0ABT8LBT2_9BACT|nr:hypothetical protein [Fulvivirgaceae bacterium BMA12]